MITPAFEILNQKGTPMFNSDLTANRPAAGVVGRVFIATDSPYGIFRDNGTTWDQVAGAGGGGGITGSGVATRVAFWDSTSSISSNANLYWDNTNSRLGINTASPSSALDIHTSLVAATFNGTGTNSAFLQFQNAGSNRWRIGNDYSGGSNVFTILDAAVGVNRLQILTGGAFTFTGSGTVSDTRTYSTGSLQTFVPSGSFSFNAGATISGGATISSLLNASNIFTSGNLSIPNSSTISNQRASILYSASGAGSVTISQFGSFVRSLNNTGYFNQFGGSASSTYNHVAAIQIYAFQNNNTGSITPVITNAYGIVMSDLNEFSHTFSFTNKWGIFQQGQTDSNYFNGAVLIRTTIVSTFALDVAGTSRFQTQTYVGTGTPNISAVFQADSTTRGWLMPRMTSSQMIAITSPASGLELYKTDGYQGVYQYIENEFLPITDGNELIWWQGFQGSSSIPAPMTIQSNGAGAAVTSTSLNNVNTKNVAGACATGTTTTGSAGIYTNQSAGMNNSTAGNKFCWRFVIVTPSALSNATDTYSITIGNGILPPGQPALNTFGFYYTDTTNGGAWTCFWNTIAGGSATSGITVATSTQYILEIEFILGTSIKYYINNSLVLTQTSGIPTALGTGYLASTGILKSAGTNSRTLHVASILARKLI